MVFAAPALRFGCRRFCADFAARFAVFPRRPSSDRATDRGSSLAVQPSSGSLPSRLARLHGRLSWVFEPPRLRAFSAQRAGTFAARRRHARVVSSCADRRATCPPEGLAYRRRWTLARHLSCALPSAAEVACGGAPESASPSEVASSCEAAIPFRGPWFVVVPPDEDDPTHVAIARQARSQIVHSRAPADLRRCRALGGASREASKVFHTAIHSLWTARAAQR